MNNEESDALIARLRRGKREWRSEVWDDMREAADALAALTAEIEQRGIAFQTAQNETLMALRKAEAERDALRELAHCVTLHFDDTHPLGKMARKALHE